MMVMHIVVVLLLVVLVFQLSSLNNKFDSLSGVAPAAAAAAPIPTAAAPSAAPTTVDSAKMEELLEGAYIKGDPDAPVTIIEYSDFECPFCARFYSDTLGQIEANYIATGKVKLAYKHFPLSFHPNAQKAGEAFECAGEQGKAYDMHDLLFENGVVGGVATFKAYAGQLGLDQTQFDTCLDNGKYASKVSAGAQEAQSVGVRGTPGFLVNGQLISGAQPYVVFQQAIDAALN